MKKLVTLLFSVFFMFAAVNVGTSFSGLNDALACKDGKCQCEKKGKNGKSKKCKCEGCEQHKKDAHAEGAEH